MSNRERVEAEANRFAEANGTIDDGYCNGREAGFIAGRTVTAEQVKAAAERSRKIDTGEAHGDMRHVLTAAGLIVEEE